MSPCFGGLEMPSSTCLISELSVLQDGVGLNLLGLCVRSDFCSQRASNPLGDGWGEFHGLGVPQRCFTIINL